MYKPRRGFFRHPLNNIFETPGSHPKERIDKKNDCCIFLFVEYNKIYNRNGDAIMPNLKKKSYMSHLKVLNKKYIALGAVNT